MKLLLLVLGVGFGRWQKAWEVAASDLKDRVDETCKLVDKIAQDATSYWDRDRKDDDPAIERRLVSDLKRLEMLRLHCAEDSPAFSDRLKVVTVLDDFFENVSSGDFQSAIRKSDWPRSSRIHEGATKLTIALRQARRIERGRLIPLSLRKLTKRL